MATIWSRLLTFTTIFKNETFSIMNLQETNLKFEVMTFGILFPCVVAVVVDDVAVAVVAGFR